MSETVLQGGRYRLLSKHGAGGLGDVWLAHDARLQRSVAIKVLRRSSPELLARFKREALATAALEHPHIVRVLDYFVEGDAPYIVMELLEGTSLSELVHTAGSLDARRAATLFAQVAAALEFAHSRGVIHRDVKPANIQVVPGPHGTELAKVLDFGIAKLSGKTSVTHDGVVLGTPAFMAPEQTTGAVADARSDVFAAGIALYFALAGRLPYPGTTPQEIHAQVTAGIREPLWRIRPDLDPRLHQIVDRATRQNPAERFASAAELREALGYWVAGVSEAMPASVGSLPVMLPTGSPPPLPDAPARKGVAIAVSVLITFGALAAFAATAIAGIWLYQSGSFDAPGGDPASPGPTRVATSTPAPPVSGDPELDDTSEPTNAPGSAPEVPPTAVASGEAPPPSETPGAPPAETTDGGGIVTTPPSSPPPASSSPQSKVGAKLCQWNAHCPAGSVCCRGPHRCSSPFRNRCAPCQHARGHQMCGSQCLYTDYDSKNCGSCGNVCPAGTQCTAGKCGAPPPPPAPP